MKKVRTLKQMKEAKEKVPIFSKVFLEGEVWKPVKLNFEHSDTVRFEVSSHGRIRSFSKFSDGDIVKGVFIKGYHYIKFRFFKKRTSATEKRFEFIKNQISTLSKKRTSTRNSLLRCKKKDQRYYDLNRKLKELTQLLETMKLTLRKQQAADTKARTIPYQAMVHRLVAEYFLEKPSIRHRFVCHLDHDKLNNHFSNLKWVTKKENFEHQQKSPRVIAARKERKHVTIKRNENGKIFKLTSTRVMLIKKEINEGTKLSTLAKAFKVSEMQLSRIKRGINWGHVKAAT